MRILLIDDEDMIRDLFRSILMDEGYEVVGATNGMEALEILKAQPVDLVITDILMPAKEGVETILEIKMKCPKMRIIAISGGGRTKNFTPLEIAGNAGADLSLHKPIEPDDLLDAVRKMLATSPGLENVPGASS